MANVSVAAEWQLLYNRYYRKPELYPMPWKHVDLARTKVAAAPFGGPVAVIRDDSKIVQLHAESALRKLRLFSSSGRPLADAVWRHPGGRLVGMSWTDDQTLLFCFFYTLPFLLCIIHGFSRIHDYLNPK